MTRNIILVSPEGTTVVRPLLLMVGTLAVLIPQPEHEHRDKKSRDKKPGYGGKNRRRPHGHYYDGQDDKYK